MANRDFNPNDFEIDLQRVFRAVRSKVWIILAVCCICAMLAFVFSFYFITPQYQSSAMFYVNNSVSVGDTSFSISSDAISAAKNLVNSYIVILKTRTTLADVIDYAEVNRSYLELQEMISAASVNSTEIFKVTVTSPDPQEAEKIANAIAYILPKRISSIIEGTSAKIVDSAVISSRPSSPNYTNNAMLGFVIGLLLSSAVIVLREIFDITIRAEEDISLTCRYPVLSAVPDMRAPSKGGYYSKASGASRKTTAAVSKETGFVGGKVSFAASEAYKLLRTKLQFSFADDNDCHVIGISSALAGEGKSLTAVNLSHSLAQLDKRVLIIDCDLRRPSVSAKLPIQKVPGLSNYLTRQISLEDIIQVYTPDEETSFHVIASGRTPPNPIELLSATRMSKLIHNLRAQYDYIILDLPPVDEVSDALVASKIVDGILLVVCQDYCNRKALGLAVRQFEFVNTRILGVVYNCATDAADTYGSKYYKKYYVSNGGSYAANGKPQKKPARTKARS